MTDHRDHCHHDHHHHHGHLGEHHAPDCDDQIPAFAHAGRGIKGDSYKVEVASDQCAETYLRGSYYDEATKTWHSEWISENINGGELSYQYNLRPYTDPRTFTITFIYRRPNNPPTGDGAKRQHPRTHTGVPSADGNNGCEWSWTTPAIPYIWTFNADGDKDTNPDHVVGSGVATLFIRTSKNDPWNERLTYPPKTTREDFNAPKVGEPWSSTITFGYGGDVEIPNLDDLAKIIGCKKGDIINILEDKSVTWGGIEADNLLDYINKCDKRDRDHFHKDLGFNSEGHAGTGAFGGEDTVKLYIDKKIKDLKDDLQGQLDKSNALIYNLYGLLDDLVNHIYGASLANGSNAPSVTPAEGGQKITWSPDATIPQGNLNVYADDDREHWIKTHANVANDDVWAR